MAGRLSGGCAYVEQICFASRCRYILKKIVNGSLRRAYISHLVAHLAFKPMKTSEVSHLQGKVGYLQGEVSHLQGKVSHLKGKVSHLKGKVGHLQGKVRLLQGKVRLLQGKVRLLQGKVGRGQGKADRFPAVCGGMDGRWRQVRWLASRRDGGNLAGGEARQRRYPRKRRPSGPDPSGVAETQAEVGISRTPPGCRAVWGQFTGGGARALPPAKFQNPSGIGPCARCHSFHSNSGERADHA